MMGKPAEVLARMHWSRLTKAGVWGFLLLAILPAWGETTDAPSWARIVQIEQSGWLDERTVKTARETLSHSTDTPDWSNPVGFEKDVFTFARLMFQSSGVRGGYMGYGGQLGWWVDYPDADLNLSYRLQQLTTLRTDPDARVLFPLDPDLRKFPFLFMSHPENIVLSEREAAALRAYVENGGVLVMIDLWNAEGWQHFASVMTDVLPGRRWVSLDTSHPIFHSVYNIEQSLHELRMPTLQFWNPEYRIGMAPSMLQIYDRGPGSDDMHVRAILDEKGRIMVFAIHNSDISDGWEREGENEEYFRQFSEKIAYPIGINLVVYLMTH